MRDNDLHLRVIRGETSLNIEKGVRLLARGWLGERLFVCGWSLSGTGGSVRSWLGLPARKTASQGEAVT